MREHASSYGSTKVGGSVVGPPAASDLAVTAIFGSSATGRALGEAAAAGFAVVFIGASLGKIESFQSWAQLLARFPVRPAQRTIALFVVPTLELATAVLIIVAPALGLIAGAALLAAFALVLLRYLSALRGADCGCFGNLGRGRIDVRLIVRNIVLAVVAGGVSALDWASDVSSIGPLVLALAFLVGLIVVLLSAYRSLPQIAGVGELPEPGENT
jgi:hypothetical protein